MRPLGHGADILRAVAMHLGQAAAVDGRTDRQIAIRQAGFGQTKGSQQFLMFHEGAPQAKTTREIQDSTQENMRKLFPYRKIPR